MGLQDWFNKAKDIYGAGPVSEVEAERIEGYENGFRHAARVCYSAVARVLMRGYGFDKDKVVDFLRDVNLMTWSTKDMPDKVQEALDEAGVTVQFGEGEQVTMKEARPVLCDKCLFGDQVGMNVWDCDMIDGITSGKTVCKHFKER